MSAPTGITLEHGLIGADFHKLELKLYVGLYGQMLYDNATKEWLDLLEAAHQQPVMMLPEVPHEWHKGHHKYTPVVPRAEVGRSSTRHLIPTEAPPETTWQKQVLHHWELMQDGRAYAVYGKSNGVRRRLGGHDTLVLLDLLAAGLVLEYKP